MYIYIKGYCLDYGLRMWPVQGVLVTINLKYNCTLQTFRQS